MCSTSLSSLHDWFFGYSHAQIYMTGLDHTGKTSILYRLKLGKVLSSTVATIGFNLETITYKKMRFRIWDFGGGPQLRILNRRSFGAVDELVFSALVFVVDSTYNDAYDEAQEELKFFLDDVNFNNCKILVFNNMCDKPGATPSREVAERLGLTNITNREWAVQKCSAVTGEGLMEGLETLYLAITGTKPMQGDIC